MINKFQISALLLLFNIIGIGQKSALPKFNFYNENHILYVIGENHFENNEKIHLSIIEYITDTAVIDNLILEVPIEIGKRYNKYVNDVNSKIENIEDCFVFFNKKSRNNEISILNYIKEYNSIQIEKNKIQIKGIDHMSMYPFKQKIKYFKIIYPELENINTTFLKETIYRKHFKKSKSKTKEFQNQFQNDIKTNLEIYKSVLDNRFSSFYRDVSEISLSAEFSYIKMDGFRTKFMKNQVLEIVSDSSKSILICGAFHAIKKDENYPYSIVDSSNIIYPNRVFSIILQDYERKKIRLIFPEFNLLNVPMKTFFEDKNKKYHVVLSNEKYVEEDDKDYFDMIIICNRRIGGGR